MKRLTKEEKHEYRFIFSEALGLPTPPKTPRGADERFLVKLMKFEESKFHDVLREVAWAKTTEVDKTVLYQFYMSESYEILFEVPSIVKEYVSKEVAQDLVAKLNAAGGVAVIEEVDEEKE
ncbi:hypothetical protein Rs2_30785 [Raphanus sativus]|uniref:Uncharacterized protein LOC130496989 n=1 Tax=Raphanus sativus TaxID=3726 RepID=A0A9W3C2E3_RAPSA|nr:uncharacterized protein LOC130496989 [Raphanus sativus]XP_056845746.1 uncharacterized protein LOC130496989 [Raphanus sativus]KAJ4891037.1 hypothetical protein Rs2_30785 [Raphanus sativus]